jgi:hypothetical protein
MKHKSWDSSAQSKIETIHRGHEWNFDGDYMFERMMDRLVRAVANNDVQEIHLSCGIIADEAARGLNHLGKWDPIGLLDLLVRKQHDYGHDNINAFGQVGLAVRMCDKIARYYNLNRRGHGGLSEPMEDCLVDMVGYGVISRMLWDGTFDLELDMD